MTARVKICGLNSGEAFDAAIDAGADWVGFVFYPPSPRFVTPPVAAALSARRPGGAKRVGLFVRPSDAEIAAALDAVSLDILQVYDEASPAAALRARFGLPTWRAVGVQRARDLPTAMDGADALLIEPKAPARATRPGGNGLSWDFSLLDDWSAPGPWILAGGLTPETVAMAIDRTGAEAVDVSSGVETAPGAKDAGLIRAFIAAARSAG